MKTTRRGLLRKFNPDAGKMKKLIQYICWKVWKDRGRGVTREELCEILYLCDMKAYEQHGTPITGYEYYREPEPKKAG